jgi:hypothetical protein
MTSRISSAILSLIKTINERLIYSYDSNPIQTVKERSPQHCGTMVFDIVEEKKKKLIGGYWTGRKTTEILK